MSDSLLIVSFSPIQSFISEARRIADLSAGSKILARMAEATRRALGASVIYPQSVDDAPNVLVAIVATDKVKDIAQAAKDALQGEWKHIAQQARQQVESQLRPDSEWDVIWDRQIANQWEFYWGAAELNESNYRDSYDKARKALDAAKRARFFDAAEEDGLKDSLSGARSALHTKGLNAKEYWQRVAKSFDRRADVRVRNNERLDAVGIAKRFYVWAGGKKKGFDSANDVATSHYRDRADQKLLAEHARSTCALLDKDQFWGNDGWPESLDADFLYEESLALDHLKRDYELTDVDSLKLEAAQRTLKNLYQQIGRPPTYYAIVRLDGDDMGRAVDACQTIDAHKKFSRDLSDFAKRVHERMKDQPGQVIYAGGDDVLAFLPLATALEQVNDWAQMFSEVKDAKGKTCSASAGIAIVHRSFPLSAALRAAHEAERGAKVVNRRKPGGAICVHWLKRSGEELRVRSLWGTTASRVDKVRGDFNEGLSTRFPYELAYEADLAAMLPDENARLALLKRLLRRHTEQTEHFPVEDRAKDWLTWSRELDEALPEEKANEYTTNDEEKRKRGFSELARWLIFARFLNQAVKGGE